MPRHGCSFKGCTRDVKARALCNKHYAQWWRKEELHAISIDRKERTQNTCDADNCDRPVVAKGYCSLHYSRHLRHGDHKVNYRRRPPKEERKPPIERIIRSYDETMFIKSVFGDMSDTSCIGMDLDLSIVGEPSGNSYENFELKYVFKEKIKRPEEIVLKSDECIRLELKNKKMNWLKKEKRPSSYSYKMSYSDEPEPAQKPIMLHYPQEAPVVRPKPACSLTPHEHDEIGNITFMRNEPFYTCMHCGQLYPFESDIHIMAARKLERESKK